MDPLKIIGLIQPKKKSQLKWASLSIDERYQALSIRLLSDGSKSLLDKLISDMKMTSKDGDRYVHAWLKRFLATRQNEIRNWSAEKFHLPLGSVLVASDSIVNSRHVLEMTFDALLSGNSVFLFSSSQALHSLFHFEDDLKDLCSGFEFAIEDFHFTASHPSVKSCAAVLSNHLAKATESLLANKKIYRILTHGKNSAVVCADFKEEDILNSLIPSFTLSNAELLESISRIYCVESEAERLLKILKDHWPKHKSFSLESRQQNFKEIFKQVKAESGKPVAGEIISESEITALLIKDLPNCSELMQVPLLAPIVTFTEIKYQFDAAKWVNNTDFGLCCSVYGDDAKVIKLANKYEVANVAINSWSFEFQTTASATKSSVLGQVQGGPFSSVYSGLGYISTRS